MGIKGVLFNGEMVRALLDNRKTVTRRVIKPQPINGVMTQAGFLKAIPEHMDWGGEIVKTPYHSGDVLYVRETWREHSAFGGYIYKANYAGTVTETALKWKPSLHMPKEAARIFLRVTDVRAERLQDITIDGVEHEGIPLTFPITKMIESEHLKKFITVWNSTIKTDAHIYDWQANPWVWVIEFERISKEDAYNA